MSAEQRRPRRPSPEDYQRALGLYRANASPESIADRVGISIEQVEHAMLEGWPATGGRHPKPALRAWEHEIEDRLHRLELARLDWAQAVVETAAVHARDWSRTVKNASGIKQAILTGWAMIVQDKVRASQQTKKPPTLSELAIPIELVRSLRALHAIMDPMHQAKIADVYRFLRGGEEEEDGVGEMEKIQAALAGMTGDQIDMWVETNERPDPDQKVLPFPGADTG